MCCAGSPRAGNCPKTPRSCPLTSPGEPSPAPVLACPEDLPFVVCSASRAVPSVPEKGRRFRPWLQPPFNNHPSTKYDKSDPSSLIRIANDTGVVARQLYEEIFNSLRCEIMNRVMLSAEPHHEALGRTIFQRGDIYTASYLSFSAPTLAAIFFTTGRH
jgi:hypothetical protein